MASKRRWILGGVLALAGIASATAATWLPDLDRRAEVGAGYVARQGCSCVFVAGRDLAACRADMLPAMDRIRAQLIDDPDRKGVRAWIPLLTDRTALFQGDTLGCALF